MMANKWNVHGQRQSVWKSRKYVSEGLLEAPCTPSEEIFLKQNVRKSSNFSEFFEIQEGWNTGHSK